MLVPWRVAPAKSDLPNRKVGNFPLPSHHFSGDLLLVSGKVYVLFEPWKRYIHRYTAPSANLTSNDCFGIQGSPMFKYGKNML